MRVPGTGVSRALWRLRPRSRAAQSLEHSAAEREKGAGGTSVPRCLGLPAFSFSALRFCARALFLVLFCF